MKISQGDTVVVIAGKDKGKKGTVMRILSGEGRVVVAGINMVTKHIKKTTQAPGQKMRLEHSIHISNISAIDPKSGAPTRVGYKIDEKTGHKVRIARKSGATIERVRISAEDAKKAVKASQKPGEEPAKKSPFWKKGSATTVAADGTSRTEEGPATSTVGHTRSAGRGS